MKKQLLLAVAMILAVVGLSACGNGNSSESGASSSEKTVKKTVSKEMQTLKKVLAEMESRANSGQVATKRRSKRLNQRKYGRSKRCLRHRKVKRVRRR
ncbi:hypothetical protein [Ligilactobacillus ruminis]|uniref:hypothetical protein n=1 Tax=Ligilactobacillus ruminis TaxID=1623 RepID=UPI00232E456B|nr:hypothetical protein [Ligilactobacillus ruminis]MDB7638303.1 hypothetical protein [Ligilactobacillus ruminis]MDB7681393.1 hypothetical protein [Ligilactobacillus ruminis]